MTCQIIEKYFKVSFYNFYNTLSNLGEIDSSGRNLRKEAIKFLRPNSNYNVHQVKRFFL